MLGWYLEDYAEFVKRCEMTVEKIKVFKQMNSKESVDWRDVVLEIAQQQAIIADQAGVMD